MLHKRASILHIHIHESLNSLEALAHKVQKWSLIEKKRNLEHQRFSISLAGKFIMLFNITCMLLILQKE